MLERWNIFVREQSILHTRTNLVRDAIMAHVFFSLHIILALLANKRSTQFRIGTRRRILNAKLLLNCVRIRLKGIQLISQESYRADSK